MVFHPIVASKRAEIEVLLRGKTPVSRAKRSEEQSNDGETFERDLKMTICSIPLTLKGS